MGPGVWVGCQAPLSPRGLGSGSQGCRCPMPGLDCPGPACPPGIFLNPAPGEGGNPAVLEAACPRRPHPRSQSGFGFPLPPELDVPGCKRSQLLDWTQSAHRPIRRCPSPSAFLRLKVGDHLPFFIPSSHGAFPRHGLPLPGLPTSAPLRGPNSSTQPFCVETFSSSTPAWPFAINTLLSFSKISVLQSILRKKKRRLKYL